jgi:phospholipase/carboxylesterase
MRKLGPLKCIDSVNNDDAPWIIFFHGYGADAGDLAPLAQEIPTATACNWLFPEGFLEVPIGWNWVGRAWWPVNVAELQEAQAAGVPRDLSKGTPAGLDVAYKKASEMLSALKVPWNKIILGGFSQGAMLATELYLNAPEAPLGLVMLSGACLHADLWREKAKDRTGKTFFLAHGESDPVLSIKGAQKLETILTQSGMKGRLMRFQGGHEIPPHVLAEVSKYINVRL